MARDKTFNALDSVFDEEFENDNLTTELSSDKDEPEPEKQDNPDNKPVKKAQSFNINFEKKKTEAVTRTFRINSDISKVLNSIVNDDNGEKKEGSKGFLSKLVNNGIIKELVELGALDESYLKEIAPYDE